MKAILTVDFSVAPDGHTTYHHKAGDTLTGKAAEIALANEVAYSPVEEVKIEPPVETKRRGRK